MVVKAFIWKKPWNGECLDEDRGDACSGDAGREGQVYLDPGPSGSV